MREANVNKRFSDEIDEIEIYEGKIKQRFWVSCSEYKKATRDNKEQWLRLSSGAFHQ
jgi:hypothetical protein